MRWFYVSAIDGNRSWLLAGPYAWHETALERVAAVQEVAYASDPYSWFYAWGTCGSDVVHKTPLGANWCSDAK